MRAWFLILTLTAGCRFELDGADGSFFGDLAGADLSGDDLPVYDLTGSNPDLAAADLTTMIVDLTSTGSNPVLNGSFVVTPQPLTVNLTTDGTSDWAHWGLVTPTSFDHKASGGTQISNYTATGTVQQIGGEPVGFTWTDGTPTGMQTTATTTGVYTNGNGHGFQITAPADTTTRTLTIYLGGQASNIAFRATLSDGSAPDYNAASGTQAGLYARTATLVYRAASSGQTLTCQWNITTNGMMVFTHLQGATLQ
jgi:hypothetical protein